MDTQYKSTNTTGIIFGILKVSYKYHTRPWSVYKELFTVWYLLEFWTKIKVKVPSLSVCLFVLIHVTGLVTDHAMGATVREYGQQLLSESSSTLCLQVLLNSSMDLVFIFQSYYQWNFIFGIAVKFVDRINLPRKAGKLWNISVILKSSLEWLP